MANAMWRHKVSDYDEWKRVFDEFRPVRKAAGEKRYSVGTVNGDPNNLYVWAEFDSVESILAFNENPDLAGAMKAAGVLEKPDFFLFEELEVDAT